MVAVPYLTGLALGSSGNSNQGVRLVGFGQCAEQRGRTAATYMVVSGPGSGTPCTIRANEALGIIAKDSKLQNKVLRRFPGGGISVFYTDDHSLAPGEAIRYPRPRSWYTQATGNPPAPVWPVVPLDIQSPAARKWLDDVDAYSARGFPSRPPWPRPARTRGRQTPSPRLHSFRVSTCRAHSTCMSGRILARGRRSQPIRCLPSYGWHLRLREDLGGLPAFAEGVARVQQVGRVVGLYIASKTVRNDSRIFTREFAGTRPEDWLLMETLDTKLPAPDKDGQLSFWVCPRYGPWQDHLARLCKDLLRQTGARYIRLDELGEAFVVCHNPKHGHPSPWVSTPEMLELLRKVRTAMDEVDPQAALFTEGAADLMQLYCDGTLAMWGSGNEIAPMRLASPDFVGFAYGLGQVSAPCRDT